jgi:hypothetical protein
MIEQKHSKLAYRIQCMANAIRMKYETSGKKMTDEDQTRVSSLEAIAEDHARKAIFQDAFYR